MKPVETYMTINEIKSFYMKIASSSIVIRPVYNILKLTLLGS